MSGVNKVILVGNLGKDPEVRHLENGSVVANLTLATTESWKDKAGNRQEITEWHDLEMWDGLAKIAEQYLTKGKTIYVEGRIKSDSWQDEQGNPRKRTKIRVQNMTMIGGRGNSEGAPQNYGGGNSAASAPQNAAPMAPDPSLASPESDDLPF